MDETATSNVEVDVAISPIVSTPSNVVARATKGHVLWWELPAPRLQASDSEEHISSVISANFGLGVDMSVYLSPARMVIDGLTSEERDNYKAKGIRGLKIAAAWKRWKSMDRQQHAKFINVLYSLAQCPVFSCTILVLRWLTKKSAKIGQCMRWHGPCMS